MKLQNISGKIFHTGKFQVFRNWVSVLVLWVSKYKLRNFTFLSSSFLICTMRDFNKLISEILSISQILKSLMCKTCYRTHFIKNLKRSYLCTKS